MFVTVCVNTHLPAEETYLDQGKERLTWTEQIWNGYIVLLLLLMMMMMKKCNVLN
jgi:hypothetical protein